MPVNVAIVIPTKGHLNILKKCVDSIYRSQHTSYHVFIADTGSSRSQMRDLTAYCAEKAISHGNISLVSYKYYNFAKINNDMISYHVSDDFDALLLCNNDIEFIDDVISEMVKVYSSQPSVGTIGCKLVFQNNRIQHAGQFIKIREVGNNLSASIGHIGYKDEDRPVYSNARFVIGNTFACAMTPLSLFRKIWLNTRYKECFEDVEYNLKCLLDGRINIYLGGVKAYHYESYTRGKNAELISDENDDYYETLMPFIDTNLEKLKKYFI